MRISEIEFGSVVSILLVSVALSSGCESLAASAKDGRISAREVIAREKADDQASGESGAASEEGTEGASATGTSSSASGSSGGADEEKKPTFEEMKVQKLEVRRSDDGPVCPGWHVPLVVVAKGKGGTKLVTEGAGEGELPWEKLEVTTDKLDKPETGVVGLSAGGIETVGDTYLVKVRSKHHDDVSGKLEIVESYDCEVFADFTGSAGPAGRRGQSGVMTEGNGGDGSDGGDGGDGDDIEVRIAKTTAPESGEPLLQVKVESRTDGRTKRYLVDPKEGKITVSASGGPGGPGGPGGSGHEYGAGGNGGNGGHGGDGGRIEAVVDTDARPFMSAVKLKNAGGAGGPGGTAGFGGHEGDPPDGQRGTPGRPGRSGPEPEVRYQSLGPLWQLQ